MRKLALNEEEPASARVAAARLATELEAERPADGELDAGAASVAEIDQVIRRLEGKA